MELARLYTPVFQTELKFRKRVEILIPRIWETCESAEEDKHTGRLSGIYDWAKLNANFIDILERFGLGICDKSSIQERYKSLYGPDYKLLYLS